MPDALDYLQRSMSSSALVKLQRFPNNGMWDGNRGGTVHKAAKGGSTSTTAGAGQGGWGRWHYLDVSRRLASGRHLVRIEAARWSGGPWSS
jgi:hypothetical protein